MIIDSKAIACRDCIFWSRNLKPGMTNGQCRRFPPVIERTDAGLKALWPLTEPFAWCGEHSTLPEGVAE